MKINSTLVYIFTLLSVTAFGQVGIRTIKPKADLEIVSSPTPGIDNYNGIIIPKVTTLPLSGTDAFPKPEQAGLVLYLNSTDTNTRGIYMFDGTNYVKLEDGALAGAFYDTGTTTIANSTSANIQRSGNVSIGSGLNSGRLNVEISDTEPLTNIPRIALKLLNSSTSKSEVDTYGADLENASEPIGATKNKVGLRSVVTGSGTANHVGIINRVTDNASATNGGTVIGIDTQIGNVLGDNLDNYGIKSSIGDANSTGNIYGIYSKVLGNTTVNKYSGYFQGANFAIRNADNSTGYNLTVETGTAGQVLTTDGSGIASWVNPKSDSQIAFFKTATTTAATTTTDDIFRTGKLSIGEDRTDRQLNVKSTATATSPKTTFSAENSNTESTGAFTFAASLTNSSQTIGEKIGLRSDVSGSGIGTHIGIDNIVTDASGTTTNYGIRSKVGATDNVGASSYGIYSEIGTSSSRGSNYAIYAYSNHGSGTSDLSYSGYFRGDFFGIRSEDEATGYNLTVSTGTSGQVLTSNGNKTTSWTTLPTYTEVDGSITNEGSLTVAAGGANDSQIQSNTDGSTNVTIAGGNGIQVAEVGNTITIATPNTVTRTLNTINGGPGGAATPVGDSYYVRLNPTLGSTQFLLPDPTTVPGRTYILYNTNTTIAAEVYRDGAATPGNRFQASDSNTPIASITLDTIGNTKTLQVFSDGVNWVYGSWGF